MLSRINTIIQIIVIWFGFGSKVMLFAQDRQKLAIVDFEVMGNIRENEAGAIVAELFGAFLSDKYKVVERLQIAKIIKEQKFQISGIVRSSDQAAKLGQILEADFIVVGSVSKLGETITVLARLVDVETGQWGEKGYIYVKRLGEIPENLPSLLSKMKLLGKEGLKDSPKIVTSPRKFRVPERKVTPRSSALNYEINRLQNRKNNDLIWLFSIYSLTVLGDLIVEDKLDFPSLLLPVAGPFIARGNVREEDYHFPAKPADASRDRLLFLISGIVQSGFLLDYLYISIKQGRMKPAALTVSPLRTGTGVSVVVVF